MDISFLKDRRTIRIVSGLFFVCVMLLGPAVSNLVDIGIPSASERIFLVVLVTTALVCNWFIEFTVVPQTLERLSIRVRSVEFFVPFLLWVGNSFLVFTLGVTLGFVLTPMDLFNTVAGGQPAFIFGIALLIVQAFAFSRQVSAAASDGQVKDIDVVHEWLPVVYAAIVYLLVWSTMLLNGTIFISEGVIPPVAVFFVLMYGVLHRVQLLELLRWRQVPLLARINVAAALLAGTTLLLYLL